MIDLIIPLIISTVFFFTTSLYYRSKYKEAHLLAEIYENTAFDYHQNVVNLDQENESLKKIVDNFKLENSELKSGIYTGYTSPSTGHTSVQTMYGATVNSNGHLE